MSARTRLIPRLIVAALIVVLGVVVATRLWPKSGPSPRLVKRVVLLTIDTLRADALPFHGNARVQARNLSELCRHSLVFDRAQATSPWTRPSIMSILTGLPPAVHGATDWRIEVEALLPDAVPTLAECMQRAGYRTAAIGYNPFIASSPNVKRGFQDCWLYPAMKGRAGAVDGSTDQAASGGAAPGNAAPRLPGHVTDGLTQVTRDWVREHADQDFFLWVHYYDPHCPYTPRREDFAKLVDYEPPKGEAYDAWRKAINDGMRLFMELQRDSTVAKPGAMKLAEIAAAARGQQDRLRALYDAEVEHVDRAIGRLVDHLKELGLYEDTLIVVTSDHGEEFFEHDALEHGHSLYEELLRVPLIIKPPGGREGRRVAYRVSNQSLFPTILELCGIASPPDQSGCPSLVPELRSQDGTTPTPFLVADSILYGKAGVAIVFGDKKYVFRREQGAEELYDLAADPGETTSLVSRDHAALTEARAILARWRRSSAALKKRIWSGRYRTTQENQNTREMLRSHGYLK